MGERTFFETTRILNDFFVVDKSWNLTMSPKDKIIFIKNGIQNAQSVLRSNKSLILKKVFEVKLSHCAVKAILFFGDIVIFQLLSTTKKSVKMRVVCSHIG